METELISLMPHATIKSLRLVDYSQFVKLEELVAFQQSGIPPDHAPPHWTQEEFENHLNRGEIIKGIFDHDKLFAFYIFCMKSGELYITEMGVHPNYRGRGFGKCIMLLLEKEANNRALKKSTLTVDPFNERATQLYFHCGFKITAYKTAYFGNAYPNSDRFWMEKDFGASKEVEVEEETLEISVNNASLLKSTLQNGFIGIELIRSLDQDCKHNSIVFRK